MNREKFLELAIQAGATAENAQQVAEDFERWAKEETPEAMGVSAGPLPIDFSKQQLLRLKGNHDLTVTSTGQHEMGFFWAWRPGETEPEDFFVKSAWELCPEKEDEKIPETPEIDWSRPQLVKAVYGPLPPLSDEPRANIVQTTGRHDDVYFSGTLIERRAGMYPLGSTSDNWLKGAFTYSGEIPASQPVAEGPIRIDWDRPQLVKDADSQLIIRTNGRHGEGYRDPYYPHFEGVVVSGGEACYADGESSANWTKGGFVYYGEIPQPQSETKTENLNFIEAVQLCRTGENYMHSPSRDMSVEQIGFHLKLKGTVHFYSANVNDILANDWQIIEK